MPKRVKLSLVEPLSQRTGAGVGVGGVGLGLGVEWEGWGGEHLMWPSRQGTNESCRFESLL